MGNDQHNMTRQSACSTTLSTIKTTEHMVLQCGEASPSPHLFTAAPIDLLPIPGKQPHASRPGSAKTLAALTPRTKLASSYCAEDEGASSDRDYSDYSDRSSTMSDP